MILTDNETKVDLLNNEAKVTNNPGLKASAEAVLRDLKGGR